MRSLPPVPILLLHGPRGIGKTTLLLSLGELLASEGGSIGGLVSITKRAADGRPWDIALRDLATGEERHLASRALDLGGPALPAADRLRIGDSTQDSPPLSFSESGIAWGIPRFRAAIAKGVNPLVLDEIGPLELEADGGFKPLLVEIAAAAGSGGRLFILTVRSGLAQSLASRLPAGLSADVEVGEANRDELPKDLALWAAATSAGHRDWQAGSSLQPC